MSNKKELKKCYECMFIDIDDGYSEQCEKCEHNSNFKQKPKELVTDEQKWINYIKEYCFGGDIESKYQKIISNYECVPMPIAMENKWLRETIELLTIPAEKIEKLEEIRRERMNREDPLNDYDRRRRGY